LRTFYFTYDKRYRFGWELGYRRTFTDYLDDVGQTYPVNALTGEPFYDQTPYLAGQYGNKSTQELFADKSYSFILDELKARGLAGDPNLNAELATHIQGMSLSEFLNYITPYINNPSNAA